MRSFGCALNGVRPSFSNLLRATRNFEPLPSGIRFRSVLIEVRLVIFPELDIRLIIGLVLVAV